MSGSSHIFGFGADEAAVLRTCLAVTRAFHLGEAPDPGALELLESNLGFLQHHKLEALLFIVHPEYRAYRDLYDTIQSAQLDVAGPLLDAWSSIAEPVFSQGTANRDLFGGHAFGRKRDIDVVMPRGALPIIRAMADAQGFHQIVFDEDMKPFPASEDAKRASLELTPVDKEFTFSCLVPFSAAPELVELVPEVLYPLYREAGQVRLCVSVEPTIAYAEGLDYEGLCVDAERRDGRLSVSSEAGMIVNACRFYADFQFGVFRPKIACEMVALAIAREIDGAALERFAEMRGLGEYLAVARFFSALGGRDLGRWDDVPLEPEMLELFGGGPRVAAA